MTLRRLSLPLLLVSLLAADLAAQEARVPLPPVALGSRVRVESRALGGSMTGTLTALDRSFLTLAPEEGPKIQIALDGVQRLETTAGMSRNVKRGLWMGAGAGAAASLLYEPNNCTGPFATGAFTCSRANTALLGAAGGAAAGGVVGFFFKTERWTVVPFDRTPTTDGLPRGLVVAYRF